MMVMAITNKEILEEIEFLKEGGEKEGHSVNKVLELWKIMSIPY